MKKVGSSKPIRILQIGMHDQIGGVETFLMNYYRNINRKEIQFDFIDMHNGIAFKNEILKLGGKIYKIPTSRHPIKQFKAINSIIKKNDYQIVHIHMLSAANILPVLATKSTKATIVSHSHNSDIPKGILRKSLHQINKNVLSKASNQLWACSQLAGEWLFNKNVTVVPNAIDMKEFQFSKEQRRKIRNELNIDNSTLVIGHVGRFEEQKNHNFLIEIFKNIHEKNPDTILMLIGDGKLLPKIEEKVQQLDLEKSVIFLGKQADIAKYYSAMDQFILPSKFEGLPLVAIEAQASGLPCIMANTISREVKISKDITFLPINEASHWAEYVLKKNQPHRRTYPTKCERYEQYSITAQVSLLSAKYKQLLKQSDKHKKTILHITGGLQFGGVEAFLYNYFSHINTKKYNLFIISHEKPNRLSAKRFEGLGFTILNVPSKHENLIQNYKQLRKLILQIKPDIIHSHLTLSNYVPLMIAKRCKVKHRISHSHLSYPSKDMYQKLCSSLTKHYATHYLACGETAARYLYGNSKKTTIMHNAIDLEKYKFNWKLRKKIRNSLKVNDSCILYGNIGRLRAQKNQLFLLEIFKHLHEKIPQSKLLIIGDGKYKSKILQRACELKIKQKLILLDGTDQAHQYYNAMDVFIFPSTYEGLGMTLIEAQFNNLQCFASNAVPMEAKLTNSTKYISLNLTAKEWAKQIIYNTNTQRLSSQIIEKHQEYDILSESQKLDDYYTKILGEKYDQ